MKLTNLNLLRRPLHFPPETWELLQMLGESKGDTPSLTVQRLVVREAKRLNLCPQDFPETTL